jgi:hypothetical protein
MVICQVCQAETKAVPFGDGFIAACEICNIVTYNSKEWPEEECDDKTEAPQKLAVGG